MLLGESTGELCEPGGAVPCRGGAACPGSRRGELWGTATAAGAGRRKALLVLHGLQGLILQKTSLTPCLLLERIRTSSASRSVRDNHP